MDSELTGAIIACNLSGVKLLAEGGASIAGTPEYLPALCFATAIGVKN
jgi:hypothetical protein